MFDVFNHEVQVFAKVVLLEENFAVFLVNFLGTCVRI